MQTLRKEGRLLRGVIARDLENGQDYQLHARLVVNATGVFADAIRRLDEPAAQAMIALSQGIHLVLNKSFLLSGFAELRPLVRTGDDKSTGRFKAELCWGHPPAASTRSKWRSAAEPMISAASS